MTTTFTGWRILPAIYLLIASVTIACVVVLSSGTVSSADDIGDHIGLCRNQKRPTSKVSACNYYIPKSWSVGPGKGTLGVIKSCAGDISILAPNGHGTHRKEDI